MRPPLSELRMKPNDDRDIPTDSDNQSRQTGRESFGEHRDVLERLAAAEFLVALPAPVAHPLPIAKQSPRFAYINTVQSNLTRVPPTDRLRA